ncbi:hypothetical protein VF21_04841 [Pseudogymnoascus sp. 05NY08]|nr:hypothetical protein VF21_04841 [Pseudogymnoascus sp. 05NY08]
MLQVSNPVLRIPRPSADFAPTTGHRAQFAKEAADVKAQLEKEASEAKTQFTKEAADAKAQLKQVEERRVEPGVLIADLAI